MKNHNNISIAKRYAKSLFDIMLKEEIDDSIVLQNLKNIKTILNSCDELYSVLINPIVSAKDKIEIINSVFEKDTDENSRNFLKLLVEKNRFNIVFAVIDEFKKLLNKFKNIQKVDVICAIELNEEQKQRIQEKIAQKLNKQIDITYDIDKSIIAGLVYKFGDDVLNTSFLYKFEEFKRDFIKN